MSIHLQATYVFIFPVANAKYSNCNNYINGSGNIIAVMGINIPYASLRNAPACPATSNQNMAFHGRRGNIRNIFNGFSGPDSRMRQGP